MRRRHRSPQRLRGLYFVQFARRSQTRRKRHSDRQRCYHRVHCRCPRAVLGARHVTIRTDFCPASDPTQNPRRSPCACRPSSRAGRRQVVKTKGTTSGVISAGARPAAPPFLRFRPPTYCLKRRFPLSPNIVVVHTPQCWGNSWQKHVLLSSMIIKMSRCR
jgi:hypothetical protein